MANFYGSYPILGSGGGGGSGITALTGDVAASGTGSVVATIQPNVVTNAKLAQMPTLTIKGNNTGGTANALDLTVAQVNAILPVFTSTLNGLAPLSGGGTTNFLRADGTWAVPTAGTGTVTSVAMTVPTFLSVAGSPVTTSGTLAVTLSGTALPIANGGTAVTSVTISPTASSFAGWDANKNLSANNFLSGYTTTATAAGTTTLVVGSTYLQFFTGATTQTVLLPVTSTLVLGQEFLIVNRSSGAVAVQTSAGTAVKSVASGQQVLVTCILTSGTTAASWDAILDNQTATSGTVTSVSVTTANGVSGSVATATTTPAITLTLGAITPSSVAASGTVTGSNLSGTNTGDITLTAVGATPSANAASLSGQALTLQPFDGTHPGIVTASGGGTTNFLRADGTWAVPAGGGGGSAGSFFNGFMSGASSWTISSSSYVAGVNSGGNALTTTATNGITVTAGASNVAGIVFTPASTSAVYLVTATGTMSCNGTTLQVSCALTDGTTRIGTSGTGLDSGNSQAGQIPFTISKPYLPGTTSPVTLQILQDAGGGVTILGSQLARQPAIEWSILRIA